MVFFGSFSVIFEVFQNFLIPSKEKVIIFSFIIFTIGVKKRRKIFLLILGKGKVVPFEIRENYEGNYFYVFAMGPLKGNWGICGFFGILGKNMGFMGSFGTVGE